MKSLPIKKLSRLLFNWLAPKKIITIAMLLLLTASMASEETMIMTNDKKLSGQQNLPREDIQRFVNAIATIHHYYINKTEDNQLFSDAIRGMVDQLDPHSMYLDPTQLTELNANVSGKFVGIGIELTLQDGMLKIISPLADSPAQQAGIKANDLIVKVNGVLIRDMSLEEAISRIKGKKGTSVSLTILRKDHKKPLHIKVKRDTINLVSVKSNLLEKDYGYVKITFFQGPVEKQLHQALSHLKTENNNKALKALVLDLRNNPGGLLDVSAQVADDFLDSEQLTHYQDYIVYTTGRTPDSEMHIKATPGDLIKGIPMVVLINRGSASASEIVAGALQDYGRAIVMGTRSFGKGSVQTILPIGEDSAIKLTTALYHTPAGQVIQARGIIPDVTVPQLSVKDLDTENFIVDESDFQNHLLAGEDKQKTKKSLEKHEISLKNQLDLAKKDYQLYQALVMLKGLNSTEPREPHTK